MKKRGKKIGLALGGGSVRGLAHIGVLKVFEKEKIPISYIAGTSMGALMGACYASGLTAEKMEELALKTELKTLVDFTEPKTGFIAGIKIEKYIRKIIGSKQFSELKIPLSIVATDITKREKVVFKKGDVARAVRASISIPGAFSSVKIGKKELVDGGIVDPVPVSVVKKMGADKIIAVNLSSNISETSLSSRPQSDFIQFLKDEFYMKELDFLAKYTKRFFVRFPKFFTRITSRIIDWLLNPKRVYKLISRKTMPNLVKIMIASNAIAIDQLSEEILSKGLADVIIKPKTKGVQYVEFDKAKEVIKAGERAAKRKMPEIKKLAGIR